MLTRNCKRILKALIKIYKNNNYNEYIAYEELLKCIKLSEHEINNSLYSLRNENLINLDSSEDSPEYIFIDSQGINYFELQWKKVRNIVIKSFITPIVVSTITSIITVIITTLVMRK